jgi:hypothetical protein
MAEQSTLLVIRLPHLHTLIITNSQLIYPMQVSVLVCQRLLGCRAHSTSVFYGYSLPEESLPPPL